jgi:hypothetical protein
MGMVPIGNLGSYPDRLVLSSFEYEEASRGDRQGAGDVDDGGGRRDG